VLGVAGSTLLNYLTQTNRRQFHQEFSQLGQDLQAGNLSAAQSDFAALQQDMPQNSTNGASQNPIGQTVSQLAQDLKSGNLSAAQQDYTTIQQDFQSQSAARQAMHGHHHHEHNNVSNSESSALNQLFSKLGSALQSGNLSNAQQYYSTLAQDLQQFTGGSTSTSSSGTSAASGVSTTA
jgi:outer membrane protein assembly factor BamD (BamD/ComL family)